MLNVMKPETGELLAVISGKHVEFVDGAADDETQAVINSLVVDGFPTLDGGEKDGVFYTVQKFIPPDDPSFEVIAELECWRIGLDIEQA